MESRLVPYALSGTQWASASVSYSFAPDGTQWGSQYQSALFAELNATAPTETWQREFARALATWAEAANLNFHQVTDDGSAWATFGQTQGDSRFGDIRLGSTPTAGLANAYSPPFNATGSTEGGDITLNASKTFYIGTSPDLYSVLLHESGHALGLDHSTAGTVLYGAITGVYPGLTADDIAGIRAIYGARLPDNFDAGAANDSLGSATSVALDSTGTAALTADMTTRTDVDYFRVVAPTAFDGTLSVAVDARNHSLLAPKISVYDAAGNLLATVSGTFGTVAAVNLTGLTPGQTYFVAADGATTDAFAVGAYKLTAQFGGVTSSPTSPPISPPISPPPPSPPTLAPDAYETNDTLGTATNQGKIAAASVTGLNLHTAMDGDYFTFIASKNGTYSVSIQFTNATGDLDLAVYNANGNLLASSATAGNGETVSLSLTGGLQYYVKVYSPTGATNTYSLSIAKTTTSNVRRSGSAAVRLAPGAQADEMLQGLFWGVNLDEVVGAQPRAWPGGSAEE